MSSTLIAFNPPLGKVSVRAAPDVGATPPCQLPGLLQLALDPFPVHANEVCCTGALTLKDALVLAPPFAATRMYVPGLLKERSVNVATPLTAVCDSTNDRPAALGARATTTRVP